jgi:hypothetical protein
MRKISGLVWWSRIQRNHERFYHSNAQSALFAFLAIAAEFAGSVCAWYDE